jgi:hypothetical protein
VRVSPPAAWLGLCSGPRFLLVVHAVSHRGLWARGILGSAICAGGATVSLVASAAAENVRKCWVIFFFGNDKIG